jgi:hypothetical protein
LVMSSSRPWQLILGAKTDLTTSAQQVHDLDILGVKLGWPGGGSWCWMNPNLRWPKKDAPWLPPNQKMKAVLLFC